MSLAVPASFSNRFRRVRTASATDTSFATRADTATEPTGAGVIDIGSAGLAATWLAIEFFGAGDANDVFDVRIYAARRSGDVWTFTPIFAGTATLGTKTGVAGGLVGAAELYADTLAAATPSYGVEDVSYRVVSPADNTKARLFLDTEGAEKVVVDFDMTTGNPTSANALYAKV